MKAWQSTAVSGVLLVHGSCNQLSVQQKRKLSSQASQTLWLTPLIYHKKEQ